MRKTSLKIIVTSKIVRNIAAALFAVLLSGFLLIVGRDSIGTFIGINENFYLKYYYDLVNGKNAEQDWFTQPDSLVLFNLQKYRNRHDIARIVDKVYECNPKIIGLDVFFSNNPDYKDEINSELLAILKKVQDKLVIPCMYETNNEGEVNVLYPFFKDSIGLDKIVYSSPIIYDFFSFYKGDDSSVNKEPLPQISKAIAQCSQMPLRNYPDSFYVNYARKDFRNLVKNDTSEICNDDFQDKIVLIGDMSEMKDMTRIPFSFGNKKEMSGIENIAYSLICILKQERSFIDGRMRFVGFVKCNPFWSVLLSFIVSFVYCFIFRCYNEKKATAKELSKRKSFFLILLHPFVLFAYEVFVVLLCYYGITYTKNIIPDLFLSMVSVALVSMAIELIDFTLEKIK